MKLANPLFPLEDTTPERRLGPHYIIREPKNTGFVGREPILTQLMEMLYDTQQAYWAVIVGMPGVGKTQSWLATLLLDQGQGGSVSVRLFCLLGFRRQLAGFRAKLQGDCW